MTEEELVIRAAAGDEQAFETLARSMRGLAYTIAEPFYGPGLEREDLLQAAMVGLWRACRTYDRSVVGPSSSFAAFASMCMRRNVITSVVTARRLKHRALDSSLSLDSPPADGEVTDMHDAIASSGQSALEVLVRRGELADLVEVIASALSPFEREALIGVVFNGESYAAVEARTGGYLGVPAKGVDNAVQRARRKIIAALGLDVRVPLGVAA